MARAVSVIAMLELHIAHGSRGVPWNYLEAPGITKKRDVPSDFGTPGLAHGLLFVV